MSQPAPHLPASTAPAVLPYESPSGDASPVLSADADPLIGGRAVRKVMWRLIPFMIVLYIMNYLDRVNVSFAKLQMLNDLGLNDAIYALGASIFFIGYFIFEIPSNLIMERVGARLWMARIMVTWGLISAAMMFVRGPISFYTLRFLLGVAEAGFFPGMILYMTYWIPAKDRGSAAAWFLTSTALSGVIGGPLAGLLMKMDSHGLRGWQWMFLIEGVPSVILGLIILLVLDDKPAKAKWLSDDERKWLEATISRERSHAPHARHKLSDAVGSGRVWVLSLLYGCIMFGFYGINYWTASVVQAALPKASVLLIGTISAIPFLAAVIGMVISAHWADRTGRRILTVGFSCLMGGIGMGLAAASHHPLLVIPALSLAAIGIWSTLGPFWALPSRFLHGTAAAAGIGLINSIGNLFGGFVGPNVMGQLKEKYHTYQPGLLVDGAVLLAGMVVAYFVARMEPKKDKA